MATVRGQTIIYFQDFNAQRGWTARLYRDYITTARKTYTRSGWANCRTI